MAYNNLMQRKARTILTVLGVVIGTAAILVMISLGVGLNESQRKNMERWGSLNVIRVHGGMTWDEEGNPTGEERKLNDSAVEEIRAMEGVAAISPVVNVGGEAKWGRKQGYLNLVGMDPSQMPDLEFTLAAGRMLEEYDRNSIIVGPMVADQFWDEREMQQHGGMIMMGGGDEQTDSLEMLDQRITFTAHNWSGEQTRQRVFNMQVVGVLDEGNMEHAWDAFMPIEEAKRIQDFMEQGQERMVMEKAVMVGGSGRQQPQQKRGRNERDYSYLMVKAQDVNWAKELSTSLRDMGYNAWSMADNLEGIEQVAKVMQAVLGGIGGISLLVAAVGITNTMVMSIYERTKEIGIMKVIGASFQDIRLLFLSEAGLIGAGGGCIGLVLSYLISHLLNKFGAGYINQGMMMEEEVAISIIPPHLALFAVAFAFFVGILAGLYPATRAMRLSPVVAIRNE